MAGIRGMDQPEAKVAKLQTDQLNVNQLKAMVVYLIGERERLKTGQNVGLQALTEHVEKKECENRSFKSRIEQLEILLARAENRLSQLSLVSGKGPHLVKGVVTPGVSKKVLETLTRENTKLKQALELVMNRGPNSADIAEENLDLSNIVMALRATTQQFEIEAEELRSALRAVETEDMMQLQEQVARLTNKVTVSERQLYSKQVFCEAVVTENKQLRVALDSVRNERVTQVAELKKELGSLAEVNPAIKSVMDRVCYGPQDSVDGDKEMYENKIHSMENALRNYQEKLNIQEKEKEQWQERITILEQEFSQSSDMNKAYDDQLQKLQEERQMLTRDIDTKRQEIESHRFEMDLMQQQLKGFENDFKMERQEKEKAISDLKKSEQARNDLDRKVTKLHTEQQELQQILRAELDRRQLQQQPPHPTQQYQQIVKKSSPPPQPQQPFGRCAPQAPWTKGPSVTEAPFAFQGGVVVMDGPGARRDTGLTREIGSPRPPPQSFNRLQCPSCKQYFPYDAIETHLTDCQEKGDSSKD